MSSSHFTTISRVLAIGLFTSALMPSAYADLVYLKNGRTVEGEIIELTKDRIRLRMNFGSFEFPRVEVARIERHETPADRLNAALRTSDMTDPDSVAELARFAARLGLNEQGEQLRELSRGLALDLRIAEVRKHREPSEFRDLLNWVQSEGYPIEVEGLVGKWLLDIKPGDPRGLQAVARLERQKILDRLEALAPGDPEAETLAAKLPAKAAAPKTVPLPPLIGAHRPQAKSPTNPTMPTCNEAAAIAAHEAACQAAELRRQLLSERIALERRLADLEAQSGFGSQSLLSAGRYPVAPPRVIGPKPPPQLIRPQSLRESRRSRFGATTGMSIGTYSSDPNPRRR